MSGVKPVMVTAVALGGALGSVARYLTMVAVGQMFGTGFPFGTLTVNALGGFAMGVLVELSALAWSPPPELRSFLTVGVLGGFTTFSTFSLDVGVLVERGEMMAAAVYVALSVVLSVGGLFAGLKVIRMVFA
ncbi:MAG TPA: fluoride efflux transporter CrcB [Azospirillaceae bacterium]|nr:fluoride efflux transporter CrcB [Azospirillaceae bacterium]